MDGHIQYANFSEAAREGDIGVLSKCTRKDTNKLDVDGMTPVHWASLYGKVDALRVLIGKGGDPDKANSVGSTALHFAAAGGHLNCLVFLTNYGCNVYAINDNGATAMQEAVSNERLDCVRHIEALVTHQVSQNKAKVEKTQLSAKKEAERRIKEKTKLLEKIDKGVEKKVRQRERIVNPGTAPEYAPSGPNITEKLPLPQLTRNNPTYNEGGECEIIVDGDKSNNEYVQDIDNDTETEDSSDTSSNYDLHNNPGTSEKRSNHSPDFSKLENTVLPRPSNPSRSSNIMATLKSLHSNNDFIPSGSFTNVSLQGCQDPSFNINKPRGTSASYEELMAYNSLRTSSRQPSLRAQSINNLPSLGSQRSVSNVTYGNRMNSNDLSLRKQSRGTDIDPLFTLLHSLQLDEFQDLFRNEKIDLSASLLCNEDDLREIGLPVGPRKKFLDAICKRNQVLRSDNDLVDTSV